MRNYVEIPRLEHASESLGGLVKKKISGPDTSSPPAAQSFNLVDLMGAQESAFLISTQEILLLLWGTPLENRIEDSRGWRVSFRRQ